MIDSSVVTLIASVAGVMMAAFLLALVRVITGFVNKSMIESFKVSKDFVRKNELTQFKNEMKRELAIERVALQELLIQQLDKSISNKINEFKDVGKRLVTIDETIAILDTLKEDFKDKISSFNMVDDELMALRKEVNKIRYGTSQPTDEEVKRRKG